MDIKVDIKKSGVSQAEVKAFDEAAEDAMDMLWSGKKDFTGWVRLPLEKNSEALEEILMTAAEIQAKCQLFVVIGIGGSFLGAKALIDSLVEEQPGLPQVIFAGNNLSGTYHSTIVNEVRKKETCICVISKSGSTTEPLAAFSVLKEIMKEKYGKKASGRIYAITDEKKGQLRKEVHKEGYESFIVPADIGGRYSVLSTVGLLPAAVAGVDIKSLLKGAEIMAKDPAWDQDATNYAAARNALMKKGKKIEIFEFFEPSMEYFGEWLKQLFGESEGKEGKGLFPASLSFTRDLHSVGQFLQEGTPVFFETMIMTGYNKKDILIPDSAGHPLAGKTLNEINQCVAKGVIKAHEKAGVPMIIIEMPETDAYYMGQMIYFFELSCAISSYINGVDPFDQPGVERYKEEARREILEL